MKKETKQKIDKVRTTYTEYASENKQRVFTWFAYICVALISVLSVLLQLVFDFVNFNASRFATNLCFSVGISVIILILSMKDGELSNETSKKGIYYDARQRFKKMVGLVVDRQVFKQFCDVLYVRERNNYIDDQLSQFQIINPNYLKVSDADLERLTQEECMCVVGYDENGEPVRRPLEKITKIQEQAILKFKKGEFKFSKLEYTFFTAKSEHNNYSYQADMTKREHRLKVFAVLYRISFIVVLNIVFALAVVNPNKVGANQVIFDIASRLFAVITSMAFGYMIANDIKKQKTDSLDFKSDIIQQFIDEKDTGAFVPVDTEKELLERIKAKEEKRKQEQEQALASVIEPEIIKAEPEKEKPEVLEIEMTAEQYENFMKSN